MTTRKSGRSRALTSPSEIRSLIEGVLPEQVERHLALSLFADSLEFVHARGPGKWGAYCSASSRGRVRLLAGDFIVLTISRAGIWLSLDQAALDASESMRRALQTARGWRSDKGDSPGGYPKYVRLPAMNIYYRPDESHERSWPPIRDLHFAFLDRVTGRYSELRKRSQRTYQPALIECLRQLLQRPLPDPVYPSTGNGRASEAPGGLGSSLLEAAADQADQQGEFSISSEEDGRQRVLASIVRRQGQPGFRRRLLEAYGGACAFSGCSIREILDAAHISPYRGPKTNQLENGLLLRTDLHTLFDLHLLSVNSDMTILVAPELMVGEYAALSGAPVRMPRDTTRPDPVALNEHYKRFKLRLATRRPMRDEVSTPISDTPV